ncbi:MAG: hypothetical protein PUD96_03030 [Coriobacteriaceae bacterium]|nr:hypothetical protein [Coriobacteriaceae bacterium]MDD6768823.1 hypothetical protein [Coriobacteriaceae bacterium]
MNESFEELLADLPAELQEQLKGAATQEEGLAILAENAIPLPDEVLEAVAGGVDWDTIVTRPIY